MKALFALTLCLSSALLFAVQPMVGKMLLPAVGATSAAWTTCVAFFQLALLAGYAFAHLVRVPPLVHVGLLLLPLATLPLAIDAGAAPPTGDGAAGWLVVQLVTSVGAPFVALAASAPALQRWFPGPPYPLYAASNAGSLAALLAYPFLLEPALPLATQARAFSIAYAVFVALALACALVARRAGHAAPEPEPEAAPAPTRGTVLRWIGLAFVPSSLMVGATTFVTTDLASLPLLWIVPLVLYLVSFVIAFGRPRAHPAPLAVSTFVLLLLPVFFLAVARVAAGPATILLHLAFLLLTGLLFHGELARTAPPRAQLTRFYLALAAGGALGGLWNTLAPWLFDAITEYPATLALAAALVPRPAPRATPARTAERERALLRSVGIDPDAVPGLAPAAADAASDSERRDRRRDVLVPLAVTAFAFLAGLALADGPAARRALVALAVPVLACASLSIRRPTRLALGLAGVLVATSVTARAGDGVRYAARSFFGVLRVEDAAGTRSLVHGTIVHGQQSLDPELRREPFSYYHADGPVGAVFAALHARRPTLPAAVGIVGLGTGMLAAYGRAGDRYTFYEIDPLVARVARDPSLFTWLADARATIDVVLGDARLSLRDAAPGGFDLLVVDAFSSHAVPMHLVTREALALYLARTTSEAWIVLHVSSRHVRLDGPVGALAADAGLAARIRRDPAPASPRAVPTTWIVLARSEAALAPLAADPRWQPLAGRGRPWTDDFSDLLRAIRW